MIQCFCIIYLHYEEGIKHMKAKTFIKIILVLAVITAVILVGAGIINTHNSDILNSSDVPVSENTNISTDIPKNEFTGLDGVEKTCSVTDFFTYGTSFCLSGSFSVTGEKTIADVYIILSQAYNSKNLSPDSETYTYSALYEELPDSVTFSSYKYINDGISLEGMANGSYCILVKAIYTDGTYDYYSLSKENNDNASICYYTVTQTEKTDNRNQRIDIGFSSENNMPYLFFNVCYDSLPDNVYDIVIDPGHGGNDVGAKNGELFESDFTLDYALSLKKALEDCGYKVMITRDGTEAPDAPMAYTMYDDDGRVNLAGASSAKLCLSLHLNSNESELSQGGVQIYVSCRGKSSFAKTLADNISTIASTPKSNMKAFKIEPGVYTRAFSADDVADSMSEAAAGGYEPYNIDTNTDYYYMIRELGGIATNAYVDGRKTTYGANRYVASIQGIESYIVELGFISVDEDLQNLLSNKDKYVESMVTSINSRFQRQSSEN